MCSRMRHLSKGVASGHDASEHGTGGAPIAVWNGLRQTSYMQNRPIEVCASRRWNSNVDAVRLEPTRTLGRRSTVRHTQATRNAPCNASRVCDARQCLDKSSASRGGCMEHRRAEVERSREFWVPSKFGAAL